MPVRQSDDRALPYGCHQHHLESTHRNDSEYTQGSSDRMYLTSQHHHRDPPQWQLGRNDNVTAEVRNDTLGRAHETLRVPSVVLHHLGNSLS